VTVLPHITFGSHVTLSVMWLFDTHRSFPIGGHWNQASICNGFLDIQRRM